MSEKEKNEKDKYASDEFKENVVIVFFITLFVVVINTGFFITLSQYVPFKHLIILQGGLNLIALIVFLLERINETSKTFFIVKYLFYFFLVLLLMLFILRG